VPDGAPWPTPSTEGLTEVLRRGALGVSPAGAPAPSRAPLTAAPVPQARPDGVRTVVVAGDGAGADARRVAEANDWPLLAEPSSGARGGTHAIPAYRLLLGEPELGGAVQRVVVLGRPTLSRPVQQLLARADVETLVVAPEGARWPDAARAADQVATEVPPLLLAGGLRDASAAGASWLDRWQRAGAAAASAIAEVLGRPGPLTGPGVAALVAEACMPEAQAGEALMREARGAEARAPEAGDAETGAVGVRAAGGDAPLPVLVVGSSNPIRDLDLVADWSEPPLVLANRGLAGIDGTISTASGVAIGLARPVRAYVGDLTFLHDVGGLLVGPLERRPDLQVVVANDDGGSIFASLEHGAPEHARAFERVFATPHGADLAAICAGYGVQHVRVDDADALRRALAAGPRLGGRIEVVEVVVDRSGRRSLGDEIARAVHEAALTVTRGR
ncbi:2-succinyl-5-enolpyruvyl-6-hydroxy-3-cyclohexene-1-carboxylate synthase, partial [Actinotalea ferrariae]|uniref:thiamine pyrophosphate-dependent enzyme n=1 Tax=Actinotalea ferrariae TaxID=1386098 RepID=UPI001EB24B18